MCLVYRFQIRIINDFYHTFFFWVQNKELHRISLFRTDVSLFVDSFFNLIMSSDRKLENLKVWNETRLFVVSIYSMLKDNRDYGFKDQIQRAAVSIMNNIAEGFEYGSDPQFLKYLRIAKGSCSEVRSMLYLCSDLGYCTLEKRKELHIQLDRIASGIYKLMEYLNKTKA